MADVVVVGAGIGGLAAAARLAKLGHTVVVCERNSTAGGMVRRIEHDGFGWDSGPSATSLPAVLRDLFRKSGRPIERYVDLGLRAVARRHVFADGAIVDLPTGSRAAQTAAVDAGLGRGAGEAWTGFVDEQSATWHALRELVLDPTDGGTRLGERAVVKALGSATSLAQLLRRSLADERLRLMVSETYTRAGSDPDQVPSYGAVSAYVERTFGVWTAPGGMAAVTAALVTRLAERKVEVVYDCEVAQITTRAGRVSGVVTSSGRSLSAEVVVSDVDPRVVFGRLVPTRGIGATGPAAALGLGRRASAEKAHLTATPAPLPHLTHLGLAGPVADLPDEVVFHGDPPLVLTTAGSAPAGHHAWSVEQQPTHDGLDAVTALAEHGLDVRSHVVARVDRTPADLHNETAGSSYGIAWDGWRAMARRARNPSVAGLYLVGASVHPGTSLPYVAWGAAHVAALVGKAERPRVS